MATQNLNIHVIAPPLVAKGTLSPSRVTSPTTVRNNDFPGASSVAKDIDSLSKNINSIISTLANTPPSLQQILVTDQQGTVVAFIGSGTYAGEYFNNYLSELHVGDPLQKQDPAHSLFNANTDGSVEIGENGWLDVLDPFGAKAAWIGTQNDTVAVTGAADSGSGLIRLTVPGHTLATGNMVRVQNVGGIGQPPPPNGTFHNNSTGMWTVTVIDSSHVDLQGSVFAGTYTSGGTIDRVLQISGAANNGSGLIRITTSIAHTYQTGDEADIENVGGVPNASGQWILKVIDTTHFDLETSTWGGAYTSGGTSLRYFAGMLAQTIAIGPSFTNFKLREFADGSLQIANATITLSDGTNSIVLDPAGPSIIVTGPAGDTIVIDGSIPRITLTSSTGTIVLDAPTATITAKSISAGSIAVSGPLNQTAANTFATTISLSGSTTGTFTFPAAYAHVPVVLATPTAPLGAGVQYGISATASVATLTTSSSVTATFNVLVIGNPD